MQSVILWDFFFGGGGKGGDGAEQQMSPLKRVEPNKLQLCNFATLQLISGFPLDYFQRHSEARKLNSALIYLGFIQPVCSHSRSRLHLWIDDCLRR